jgi:hypothetical protein
MDDTRPDALVERGALRGAVRLDPGDHHAGNDRGEFEHHRQRQGTRQQRNSFPARKRLYRVAQMHPNHGAYSQPGYHAERQCADQHVVNLRK